ncbi:hypothetical protein BGW36DRAFT_438627 [Talaromyces proteolyticus]|uniref:Uncharacterized protein n=1 Tax=Talaromyces proteolyticus TaxID=1131652 RepID=A0AAD4PVA1_9EURO|nr:uncharacterized protein BGW36DRAFT_438627 [Talaromyces proteolyticus]KAH8691133.1 hypothetical protein BGW36DRAFT_438627 [Talaromyces proteolyticus]
METAPRVAEFCTSTKEDQDDGFGLPGITLPLDYSPEALNAYGVSTRSLFPSSLDCRDIESGYINQPILTFRELKMIRLINQFTDREAWVSKAFEESYMEAYRDDILKDPEVTQKMANWLMSELKFKALVAKRTNNVINIYNGDVVKSDSVLMGHLHEELKMAIKGLEKGLSSFSEYRSATEPREFDYVHPSFFPLVFGESRVLRDRTIGLDDAVENMGKGEILEVPKDPGPSRKDLSWNIASRSDIGPRPYSSRFQWLPSNVLFRPDGTCYFSSYINSIHPQRNQKLYPMIEKALDKIILMWDMALTPLKTVLHSRSRIDLQEVQYKDISPGKTEPRPKIRDDETRTKYEERIRDWRKRNFVAVQPEPGVFAPIAIPPQILEDLPKEEKSKHRIEDKMDLKEEYGHRGLQVIVKLTEYSMTPEEPRFETEWHVEGQINEHICASAVYCLEDENTDVHDLEFRQIADTLPLADLEFDRGDSVWLEQIFGLHNNEPAVQHVGNMCFSEGRAIAWPNALQHRGIATLKDRSKTGYVHILQFMLVDPNIRIISTANVPPQRLDWKKEAEETSVDVRKLPLEDKLKILKREGNFPWALQEAKNILRGAREERRAFNHYQDVAYHSKNVIL